MTFDELYKEYIEDRNTTKELEAKFRKAMELCFDRASNLTKVVFRGSTPTWNDGDACHHSQHISYLGTDFIDDEYEIFYDEIEDVPFGDWNNLDSKVGQLIESLPLPEQIWTTNYEITVSRNEDGSIKISKEDYHSDY